MRKEERTRFVLLLSSPDRLMQSQHYRLWIFRLSPNRTHDALPTQDTRLFCTPVKDRLGETQVNGSGAATVTASDAQDPPSRADVAGC